MKFFIAYRERFARFAAQKMRVSPHEYRYVAHEEQLRGLRGCGTEIYIVNADRYEPTMIERDIRRDIEIILRVYELTAKTVDV